MGWFSNRGWRTDSWTWREYRREPQRRSFRWMLRDFLIRVVAFTVLSALALAWLKYHFMDGTFTFDF
jgi:hypothetical protein